MVKAKDGAPQQLTLGSTFGMSMKMGVPYTMSNTVIEFEPDRRIAWQTVLSGPLGRFVGGRIWRYELEDARAGTKVTETWDISEDKQAFFLQHGQGRPADRRVHDQDAGPTGRAHRGLTAVTDLGTAIDAAWDERVLPALSEYTRIPCLSPAFDPDWAERGAMAAAAELLREWVQDQDAGAAPPRSCSCPAAPRSCWSTTAAAATPS